MEHKPQGKKLSVSPAQPQSAAPTKFETLLAALTTLHLTAMETESAAYALMSGVLMDTPNRDLFERHYGECQSRRREMKRLLDEVQQQVWQDEKTRSLSDDEVQSRFANAQKTYRTCGGHYKASRNEALAKEWLAELSRRGLKPDGREGEFNGDGAS